MPTATLTEFERALASLDTRLFDRIESQSSTEDRRSLLACQLAARGETDRYVYLEVGSHLGGSLQTHVLDPQCARLYSIDKRPESQADERGTDFVYEGNSTARMLEGLARVSPDGVKRLTCIDADTQDVDTSAIVPRPNLCFIDGEHTDDAVVRDFTFCRRVIAPNGAILFHDASVIYRGLGTIISILQREGVVFRAYHLPDTIFVIELDACRFHATPAISSMLLNNHVGFLAALRTNEHYRQFANRPIFRWLRRVRSAISRKAATW